MKKILVTVFSLFLIGEAVAAPPPGLYDDPQFADNLPEQRQKAESGNAVVPVIPKAIITEKDANAFRKSPDEPLFTDHAAGPTIEDDNIFGIDFDKLTGGITENITGSVKDLYKKFTSDNKDKKTKPVSSTEPPLPPMVQVNTKNSAPSPDTIVSDADVRNPLGDFKFPITIYDRHTSEEDFLNILYANMPDIKPKDKKLEALRAEEELKRKQEELAAEQRRQKQEEERIKAEEYRKTEERRANVANIQKKAKVKHKSKREKLIDKVYGMSITGIKLGMTPSDVEDILQYTDFEIKYSNYEIPKFLEWSYRQECLKGTEYKKSDLSVCIQEKAEQSHSKYISRMDLKHRMNDESITITFSSFYSGNKAYRIVYETKGDSSLGNSERDMYMRSTRTRDFMQRVRKRYGSPDDLRNMIWGSNKDGVTLRAYVTGENVNGSIIMEDLRVGERDNGAIQQAGSRIRYDQNFSF